jgi:F-type H+-transporting ATPase subunit b
MSIDWVTVAAQIANFLVLVWLLKRFLYRPILNGIDAREAEIADRMSQASHLSESAKAEANKYRDQLETLQASASELTDAAHKKALLERDRVLAEAHRQLLKERKDFDTHLVGEKRKYIDQLNQAGASVVLHLARKALADLADATLEERIASHAVRQLRPLAADLQKHADGGDGAVVTTRDALPETALKKLRVELRAVVPAIACTFKVDPSQAAGLVLRIGSAHVTWTIDSYIEELDAMMKEQLARSPDIKVHAE